MRGNVKQIEAVLSDLLLQWGDALVSLQLRTPDRPELDGGILCPCCRMIHGRCHEAAYPLLTLAARTGKDAYLSAAVRVFRWGENMLCADGSLRNDAKSDWRGITAFGAAALHDALFYHGDLLPREEKTLWEARLSRMGEWLYENLRPGRLQAYLNYYAANACVMALLGQYFGRADYTRLAAELGAFCISHTTENLLLFGEGSPLDARTKTGCRAVDAGGYNVEETLPMLTRCAAVLGDAALLARCRKLWAAHLRWMLPDGAWDDSVGSRAFKWTYWGGRTSDGCQDALFFLGREDPVFAEAALRNAALYGRCTHGGLLYGGPDYARHGELPCVHHTFCHAKAVAGSLNGGLYSFARVSLPAETTQPVVWYLELQTLRISCGGWIADVSGYDYFPMPGAHAAGGALSLLWRPETGPLIACGAADFRLREIFNQQLPSDPSHHRSGCPRLETLSEGTYYAQYYDSAASLRATEEDGGVTVSAEAFLCDEKGGRFPGPGACALRYRFTADTLLIGGRVDPALAESARFILPLIGDGARIAVTRGTADPQPAGFFNLNPGFMGTEYAIRPDGDGEFRMMLSVREEGTLKSDFAFN